MRTATLSVDLDNKWSYLKTHGEPSWRDFPSYLDLVIPATLDLFKELEVTATVFVVGQDAHLEGDGAALQMLGASDHEMGNHSYFHEPWLHLKAPAEIRQELADAHQAILKSTGKEPVGFRGPGFSLSRQTLESLAELGYEYDCSTLPMFLGPLARLFYFRTATLATDDRDQRDRLFGRFSDGLRPIKPYRWDLGNASIAEIPVTTMPITRLPIHISYLLYISSVSPMAARGYFASALGLSKVFGVSPSILVHPLDLLGGDDVDGLGFFPGMNLDGATKRARVRVFLEMLGKDFRIIPMRQACAALNGSIPRRNAATLD